MMLKTFCAIAGLLFAAILSCSTICGAASDMNNSRPKDATLVYVGTFTGTPAMSKGIYCFWLKKSDTQLPTLVPLGTPTETQSPSFLTLDTKRNLLFCVNEISSFEGKSSGAVSAFSIDPTTGQLKFINQRPSMGAGPCHLVLDKTGRNLLVANYNNGSIAAFPVGKDGQIGEATCVIQDEGKSANPARQEGPHAHCVTMSPDNRFAFVCDLGIDKVMIFKFDAEHGKLTPNDPPFAQMKAGAGPRHLVFSPNGNFAYVVNELSSTISAFTYDGRKGALTELQTVSTLPDNYNGPNSGAEIAIVPSGKYLFASNRGNNTVASFAIDPEKGTLSQIGQQSTGGKTPRHFGIEPSGKHLLVCNQDSSTVLVCGVDAATGQLKPSSAFTEVPAAVCAVFLPPAGGEK